MDITELSTRPAVPGSSPRRWLARFAWLVLFWVAGVLGMGLVAAVLRALMQAVGLGR